MEINLLLLYLSMITLVSMMCYCCTALFPPRKSPGAISSGNKGVVTFQWKCNSAPVFPGRSLKQLRASGKPTPSFPLERIYIYRLNNHIILYYIYLLTCIITALNSISRQTFDSSANLHFIWNSYVYVSVDDRVNNFKFQWNLSLKLRTNLYTQYINYIIKCCYKLIYSVTNNCYIVTGGDHNVKP